MKKLPCYTIALILLLPHTVYAQTDETGSVAVAFACNYKDGQSRADLNLWSELWTERLATIGSEDMSSVASFLWWPVYSASEYDVLWFDYYPNLNTMGRGLDDYNRTGLSAGIESAWRAVLDCTESVHISRTLHTGVGDDITPPAVIEAYRCSYNAGSDIGDVNEVVDEWIEWLEDTGGDSNLDAYLLTPLIDSSPYDLTYFNVYRNYEDWAAGATNYLMSPESQAIEAKWQEIDSCDSSLWRGQRMHPPLN